MDDVLVYPVVFLYRHALELHIKAILLVAGLERKEIERHELDVLGKKLDQVFSDFANFQFNLFEFCKPLDALLPILDGCHSAIEAELEARDA